MHSLAHFGTQLPDLWIPHRLQWSAVMLLSAVEKPVLRYCNQVLLNCTAQQRGRDALCVLGGLAEVGFAKLAKLSPGKGSVGPALGEGTVTLHSPA